MTKGTKPILIVLLVMIICNVFLKTYQDDLDLTITSTYDSDNEIIILDLEWNLMKNPVLKNNEDLIAIIPPGEYAVKSINNKTPDSINVKPGLRYANVHHYLMNHFLRSRSEIAGSSG
ncbi:hypothetical protein SAMN02745751_03722 [Dethiosulfatibacter aminovorans DSM 17477]|uniref:Uncharacterized protein n=1 Tax=Dethiosulfatibacter aminovorans DSM 17477 TaxID=1121476 RepID=A0A1M6NAK8_9FIRM|nr:hypothetical protein [Dethiosulfatibacter aminovorans]SHJ92790.1 hypothetical protein SAMN02745751_03722 [Dethiosulfatibacter aminovorans DSM 17477]